MALTARQFACGLISRMGTSGRVNIVYVESGKVNSASEGTGLFVKVQQEKRFQVIGFYDQDCLARDLCEDIKEFFEA